MMPMLDEYPRFMAWRIAEWLYAILLCLLLLALPLWLGACAIAPEKPLLTRVETQIVKVPVPVKCVLPEQVPTIPKTSCRVEMNEEQRARCLDIDLRAMQEYAVSVDALFIACTADKT